MRLLWNDIGCSSKREIFYRGWDMALRKTGLQKRRYPMGWMSDHEVLEAFDKLFASKAELCQQIRNRKNPIFFFDGGDRSLYERILHERFDSSREIITAQADAVVEHIFSLLGKHLYFGSEMNWHFSEDHDLSWPLRHWADINVAGNAGHGDVKPVWELNRHQHFFTLGRAYWRTGDDRYVIEFEKQIKSWIDSNPAEMGINWQSNLEIALRSISWIWAAQYFKFAVADDSLLDIVRVLVHSGRHMNKHIAYSQYCMRNNHLIGDAAGLALVAIFLPELAEAQGWKDKALGILYQEIVSQVYVDGVNDEQAISYHRFVFDLCFLVVRMEQMNGADVPEAVLSRLEKMIDFVAWVVKPDGSVPMIGDGDDGRALLLGREAPGNYRPMLQAGAIAFGRADCKDSTGGLSEEILWLFGPDGIAAWDQLSATMPESKAKTFENGGYYILRSGWDQESSCVVFRSGPHSPHHAHADQLHLQLSAFGQDLLIDPGTYLYNGSQEWRNYFRGTFAHNTMVVDGESQAVPHRVFRWLHAGRPKAATAWYGTKVQWVYGGHTGYRRYTDPVTHCRGILSVFGEYVLVFDTSDALEEHDYETLFHFAPGEATLNEASRECVFTSLGGAGLVIKRLDAPDTCLKVISGQTEPVIQGWFSPSYGERIPAPVLSFSVKAAGPWSGATLLRPFRGALTESLGVGNVPGNKLSWKLEQKEIIDYVTFQKNVPLAGMETDSSVALFRFNKGRPAYLFIGAGTEVSLDGILSFTGEWEYLELTFNAHNKRVAVSGDWRRLNRVDGTPWTAEIQGKIIPTGGMVNQ